MDIRKDDFQRMENSEEHFRQMVEDASDAIFSIDSNNGIYLYLNKKAEELMRMKRDEVLGRSIWDFQPEKESKEGREFFEKIIKEGGSHYLETRFTNSKGEDFDVEITGKTIMLQGKRIIQFICRDVTSKKQLEHENKYMREYFARVLDIMPIGLGVKKDIDSDPTVEFENKKMIEMFHGTADDSLHDAWHNNAEPKDPDNVIVNENGNYCEEYQLSDGKVFQVTINYFRDFLDKWRELQIVQDITRQKRLEEELRQANESLESKIIERTKELQNKQVQLIQAEKMAALGGLVAGVAHEINTPVGALKSNNDLFIRMINKLGDILKSDYPDLNLQDNSAIMNTMEKIDNLNEVNKIAAERIVKIITSLRNFARLDQTDKDVVDIHDGLESTLTLVNHEYKRRIEVVKDYAMLPNISCFPNQLNQVFMNILMNAAQAIEDKGTVKIKTSIKGSFAVVEFTDSGVGIDKDNIKKIFDPGFTTKGVGVGTGLGLSIVHQIIQAHEGKIEVESEPGIATTFRICLPINSDNQAT